jgi:hypothetical protein
MLLFVFVDALSSVKPIVPVQADMTGCSSGALFEAVVKLSCEIIEFGWTKDRALVDTFIMHLATYVRERNDYEEEVFFLTFCHHIKFCSLARFIPNQVLFSWKLQPQLYHYIRTVLHKPILLDFTLPKHNHYILNCCQSASVSRI